MAWICLSLALVGHALRSPTTLHALVVTAWRFRRRRWFARPPFLPLPAMDYVRWRMHTAYGHHDAVPPADDVVRYVRWAVRDG